MSRVVWVLTGVVLAASVFACAPASFRVAGSRTSKQIGKPPPPAPPPPSGTNIPRQVEGRKTGAAAQALGWIQTEWKEVQREGRAAAERVVRQYPEKFRALKAQVTRVSKVATQMADTRRLEEKRALLTELWEVRGSLDILALCSPDVIHQLTGLDTAAVASLEDQVSQGIRRLRRP